MSLQELQETRNELAAKIKELADRQGEWSAEDKESWGKVNDEYNAACKEMDAARAADGIRARAEEVRAR